MILAPRRPLFCSARLLRRRAVMLAVALGVLTATSATSARGPVDPSAATPSVATPSVATPSVTTPSVTTISICHGFGCRIEESVSITEKEWRQIKAFFREPAASPAAEREQIKKAAGWFEVIVGRHTPIHRDRGRNEYPGHLERTGLSGRDSTGTASTVGQMASTVGQMDCIDESLNMTTYLTRMEQSGLFRYHRVVERAHRRSAVDQHYAGQIEEIESGSRWVVDSWFYDYGSLPYIEEAGEWHDIPFLFSTSFPEASDG